MALPTDTKPEPLNVAESTLLDAFLAYLRDGDKEAYDKTMDTLDLGLAAVSLKSRLAARGFGLVVTSPGGVEFRFKFDPDSS